MLIGSYYFYIIPLNPYFELGKETCIIFEINGQM